MRQVVLCQLERDGQVRPAGENKGGGPVCLGSNQSLHFLAGSVVQEDLGVVKIRLAPAIFVFLSDCQNFSKILQTLFSSENRNHK